jgi:anti-sigma regulatory factor (Ser/Thr protein kinase)
MAFLGPVLSSLVRKQMDTMAPTRPTELHESTSPADLQEPTSPAKLRQQAYPAHLQKPIRPTALQKRCVSLTAGPMAPGIARGQVRATIAAWDIPVDQSVAILLTSELVTNAVMHEAGEAIKLVITCGYGQLGVDVHDTSCELPVSVDGPLDAETGRGLVLVASLSSSWGYYRTPTGKAVYFTLAFVSDSGADAREK